MEVAILKVAFIYAPVAHKSFEENLKVVDEDFGRMPPLSLLYAAAIAERAGYKVCVIDANAMRFSLDDVVKRLSDFSPNVIAGTLSTYMFRDTTAFLGELKKRFGVPVIVGGINVRLYPEETMVCPDLDYGVAHFATKGLPALLSAIERGLSPVGLPEVVARDEHGNIVIGEVDHNENPFEYLPFPARHLLDNHAYFSLISQRRPFTIMVTTTGCRYKCHFCSIASLPLFVNDLPRVLEEIRICVEQHGIREIDFFDANFVTDRDRTMAICRALSKAKYDLEWSCRARLDGLDRELLQAMSQAGCRQIYVGIETPDPKAQRQMNKVVPHKMVTERLFWMHEHHIRPLGFFMLGVPGETHRSCLRTIRYALSLPLDYAQFSRTIAKPGSYLDKELIRATGKDYWRDWILGRDVPARLPNLESELDDDQIEFYTHLAYYLFYYRPSYILKALRRVRSMDELLRGARTALRMLVPHSDTPRKKAP